MGCAQSSSQKIRIEKDSGGKIQDEARSYRSKVGAGKLVLKNEVVRVAFKKFIEKECKDDGRTEFVTYFETIEQMKQLSRDEQTVRIRKILELTSTSSQSSNQDRNQISSTLCASLRHLRALKLEKATQVEIMKAINATQDLLIAAVTPEFEKFMESEEFAELKKTNLENHKNMPPIKHQPSTVGKAPMMKKTSTIAPPRMESGFLGVGLQ